MLFWRHRRAIIRVLRCRHRMVMPRHVMMMVVVPRHSVMTLFALVFTHVLAAILAFVYGGMPLHVSRGFRCGHWRCGVRLHRVHHRLRGLRIS